MPKTKKTKNKKDVAKANIANIDFEREERCGIPEIIFGEKSAEDIAEVVRVMLRKSKKAIITRVNSEKKEEILKILGLDKKNSETTVSYNEKGRVLVIEKKEKNKKKNTKGKVGVLGIITAGTSDIGIAEEAKEIAIQLGCEVITEYDVGIAGLHRVFSAVEKIKDAKCIIVVAGMEGALPSIVSGLVKAPVIGVPSSVGYGLGKNGISALYTMLNSCTPVAVVNIDNGFGAAVLAYKILSQK